MSKPFHKFRQTRFFGSLDGLRALSILGVIWSHTWSGANFNWPKSVPLGNSAELGVALFFTISGFLITTLLLREQEKYGRISLRDFYIRRVLRIWPLYYVVLGLYVALVLATERHSDRGRVFLHNLPMFMTYTYTWFGIYETGAIFNFSWSLATEEQFYVVWPLLIRWLPRMWPVAAALVTIAARLAAEFGLFGATIQNYQNVPGRLLMSISVPICLGTILAYALHAPSGFRLLHRALGWKGAAPILLALLVGLTLVFQPAHSPLIWFALPLMVCACVVREDNGLAALLQWRPLALIGVLSYGMYLWCNLAIRIVRTGAAPLHITHPMAIFPLAAILTLFIAWISYRSLEQPFLTLKSRFSRLKSVGEYDAKTEQCLGHDATVRDTTSTTGSIARTG